MELTAHQRHERLVKIVRRDYQNKFPGSRLFHNTSGVAWQGEIIKQAQNMMITNPRPIRFGIPEPDMIGNESGGSDLIGETLIEFPFGNLEKKMLFPIITGIEIKTGNSKLKKNQIIFRNWMKSINGIWYHARECHCWESWQPIKINGIIKSWEIPFCIECDGKGYTLGDK